MKDEDLVAFLRNSPDVLIQWGLRSPWYMPHPFTCLHVAGYNCVLSAAYLREVRDVWAREGAGRPSQERGPVCVSVAAAKAGHQSHHLIDRPPPGSGKRLRETCPEDDGCLSLAPCHLATLPTREAVSLAFKGLGWCWSEQPPGSMARVGAPDMSSRGSWRF